MNKKSKVLTIGAAVAAVSLFTVTALASTPNTAGYEAFKEVLKANHSAAPIDSATLNGSFAITADGESILTANGTTKVRGTDDMHRVSSDFDITLAGVQRSASVYAGDENSIYIVDRTNDLHYQVINLDDKNDDAEREREWERGNGQPMTQAEEALLDYMVGDLKNEFSVTHHADGSKTIAVDVSKEEIPLPLRLLMDAASAEDRSEEQVPEPEAAEWERLKQFPFFQGLDELNLEERLPELKDDVAIERVYLQLTVDRNNALQRVEGELEVAGKDEAGVSRRVEIQGAGEVGALNATTPEIYDPSERNVEQIDAAAFDDRN